MKKQIPLILFCLYLVAVFGFERAGPSLRDWLSPQVIITSAAAGDYAGRHYTVFPESALQGTDGVWYIWVVEPSDAYPEDAYCVQRTEVIMDARENGVVYVYQPMGIDIRRAATSWSEPLTDGARVTVVRELAGE